MDQQHNEGAGAMEARDGYEAVVLEARDGRAANWSSDVAQIKLYDPTRRRGCDRAWGHYSRPNCEDARLLRRNGLVRRRWWVSGPFGRATMSTSARLPTPLGECRRVSWAVAVSVSRNGCPAVISPPSSQRRHCALAAVLVLQPP